MTLNYGLNRVRFTAPVPVGSRIRGRFRVEDVEEVGRRRAGEGRGDDRARGAGEAGLRRRSAVPLPRLTAGVFDGGRRRGSGQRECEGERRDAGAKGRTPLPPGWCEREVGADADGHGREALRGCGGFLVLDVHHCERAQLGAHEAELGEMGSAAIEVISHASARAGSCLNDALRDSARDADNSQRVEARTRCDDGRVRGRLAPSSAAATRPRRSSRLSSAAAPARLTRGCRRQDDGVVVLLIVLGLILLLVVGWLWSGWRQAALVGPDRPRHRRARPPRPAGEAEHRPAVAGRRRRRRRSARRHRRARARPRGFLEFVLAVAFAAGLIALLGGSRRLAASS